MRKARVECTVKLKGNGKRPDLIAVTELGMSANCKRICLQKEYSVNPGFFTNIPSRFHVPPALVCHIPSGQASEMHCRR